MTGLPGIGLSRRRLLVGAGVAVAAGAVGPTALRLTDDDRLSEVVPTRSLLAVHLDQAFTTRHDDREVTLVLRELTDLSPDSDASRAETDFHARFEAAGDLPQGTYTLERDGYGRSDVFLVAGARSTEGGRTRTSLGGTFAGAPGGTR
ncbi:DUF6916 family protein [Nocardioides sp. SYSU DS0663]|uniref:DUF6916 family protein n=1 Tax=Nocardioides sp. SYSU DS0663 TaxID=3416445 RepID=UPI003F4AFF6F